MKEAGSAVDNRTVGISEWFEESEQMLRVMYREVDSGRSTTTAGLDRFSAGSDTRDGSVEIETVGVAVAAAVLEVDVADWARHVAMSVAQSKNR